MSNSLDKKKIINILFITAIIILIANLILNKFFLERSDSNSELTAEQINFTFHSALFNLGIDKNWIKNQKGNNLNIRVPKDLPVVLILQELNYVFDTSSTKIIASEKKMGGTTTLKIISGGEEKLSATFSYNDKIKRKSARISFIINIADADNQIDSVLLEYPDQFAFLLTPSARNAELCDKILKYRKEYILYLNDGIQDLKFKLKENYSEVRIKNSIREIVEAFPKAVLFLIDNNSSLFNSEIFPLIKAELEKRKIILLNENSFINLSADDDNSAGVFNKSLENLNNGDYRIYLISAEDFISFNPEIIRFRKLGYRFTNPSLLIDELKLRL